MGGGRPHAETDLDRLAIEQATLANTLQRMERDGLISRQVHPNDRRATQNFLTERGRDIEADAIAAAVAADADLFKGFRRFEKELLLEYMRWALANFRQSLTGGGAVREQRPERGVSPSKEGESHGRFPTSDQGRAESRQRLRPGPNAIQGLGAPLDPDAAQLPITQAPTGVPPQGLEGAPIDDAAMRAPRLGRAPEGGAEEPDPERERSQGDAQ